MTSFSIHELNMFPMTLGDIRDNAVIVSRAASWIRIGLAVHEARARHEDPAAAVPDTEVGKLLFNGKINDINRRTTEGFLKGDAALEGLGEDSGHRFRVAFQNEYLMGRRDDMTVVMVPDIICLMDSESGEAVGPETLRMASGSRAVRCLRPTSSPRSRGWPSRDPGRSGTISITVAPSGTVMRRHER